MGLLEEIYPALWEAMGYERGKGPGSVLDLACGLHPLGRQWMGLGEECRYVAADIDKRMVELVGEVFACFGWKGEAVWGDILEEDWSVWGAEVVMMMKTLPCVEQQEEGAGLELLKRLLGGTGQWVVVSYPSKSLGGREKGMYETYRRQVGEWEKVLGRQAREIGFENETFYIFRGSGC